MTRSKDRKPIAVFDCETDPFKFGRIPLPFLTAYYSGKEYRSFRKVEEFVNFIRTQDVVCYAHNGGKFDFLFLVPYFDKDTKIFLINGRLGGFKLGKCEFRDSYLILPIPLSAYKKDKIDYEIFERVYREIPENLALISAYLKNDCIYLYDLISAFRKKYGSNLTIASTAMAQWRKISGERAPRQSESEFVFFKQWYFGGRVEVFKPGIADVALKSWDANRAYSAAMKKAWFPYGNDPVKIDRLPDDENELGRCFLEIEAYSKGAYPLKMLIERVDPDTGEKYKVESLEFPHDGVRRVFKVTGWEYLAALRTGTDGSARVISCFQFPKKINFSKFVDKFYDPALDPSSTDYIFNKLVGNSLYGKFGQDCREFQDFYLVDQFETLKKEKEYGGTWCDFVGKWSLIAAPQAEEKRKFYAIHVSASVTGYQRAELWQNICKTKDPYYCDTDCIHGLEFRGKIGRELGEWKIDLKFDPRRVAYAGKKMYALWDGETPWGSFDDKGKPIGWKIASKGAQLTGPQIFEVAAGKTITYKQDAPTMSLRGVKFQEREIRMTI